MIGSDFRLGLVIGMIVIALAWAIWAMMKARTPLAGDDHH